MYGKTELTSIKLMNIHYFVSVEYIYSPLMLSEEPRACTSTKIKLQLHSENISTFLRRVVCHVFSKHILLLIYPFLHCLINLPDY